MDVMATAHAVRDPDSDEAYEKSRAFLVHTPFEPGQLDAEVTKAMKWKTPAGIIVEGDPAKASASAPVRVWVERGEVDEKTFLAAVKEHKPTAPAGPDIAAIKAKAAAGEVLAGHEITHAIAHLLADGS